MYPRKENTFADIFADIPPQKRQFPGNIRELPRNKKCLITTDFIGHGKV